MAVRHAKRNLALFFEGTGQGVAGNITNVTRLHDLCLADDDQRLHLESGPGTHFGAYLAGAIHGADWQLIFRSARRWFEQNAARDEVSLFLFGFSRGALIARHFAEWLELLGFEVAYLGLWDTVDSTTGLDVAETCPSNVRVARHAVARDERRRFFGLVPLRPSPLAAQNPLRRQRVTELVFPGTHSDVGGLYDDNHVLADVALAWVAAGAVRAGLRLRPGVRLTQTFDPAAAVIHPSERLASNLYGLFSPVARVLKGFRRHLACRLVPAGVV